MPPAADPTLTPSARPIPHTVAPLSPPASAVALVDEDGSLVTEYGLLAVLGATLVGLAVKWASGGAIWELLDAVLGKAKALVGA